MQTGFCYRLELAFEFPALFNSFILVSFPAHFLGCIINVVCYLFINSAFNASEALYYLISLDSATSAMAALVSCILQASSLLLWVEDAHSSWFCSFILLATPAKIVYGPIFTLLGSWIRYIGGTFGEKHRCNLAQTYICTLSWGLKKLPRSGEFSA